MSVTFSVALKKGQNQALCISHSCLMLEIFKFIAIFIGGKTYPPLSLSKPEVIKN